MILKSKQKGRSMIEMLGVLGIMAVITVLSIAAYTMAMKNIKTNKFKSEITTILQQVRALYFSNMSSMPTSGAAPAFYDTFVTTGMFESTNAFGCYGVISGGNKTPYGYRQHSLDGSTVIRIEVFFSGCNEDKDKLNNIIKTMSFDGLISVVVESWGTSMHFEM